MFALFLASVLTAAEDHALSFGPVETVAEGFQFTEGPLWVSGQGLVFSDIPDDTIYCVKPASEGVPAEKTMFRKPSGKSNGLTLDKQGRVLACEHWNRRVTRTEKDGTITILADVYDGKKLNSPNDIVIRSDGCVFFTDPPYGLEGRESELRFPGVYAIRMKDDRPNVLVLLRDDFKKPNGLALSPDERTLYVADTEMGHICAFDVAADGTLSNMREFCTISHPDGMKVDSQGRVWSTASDGIHVFTPKGDRVASVSFPQIPANCAFGDEDGKTLYVTARTAVYKIRVCPSAN